MQCLILKMYTGDVIAPKHREFAVQIFIEEVYLHQPEASEKTSIWNVVWSSTPFNGIVLINRDD